MIWKRMTFYAITMSLGLALLVSPAGASHGRVRCRKLCKAVISCKGLHGQERRACRKRFRDAVQRCKATNPPACSASPSGAFLDLVNAP